MLGKLTFAVLVLLLLVSCNQTEATAVLVLDMSHSAASIIDSKDYRLVVENFLYQHRFHRLHVFVAAASPLHLQYQDCQGTTMDRIVDELTALRIEQARGEIPDERLQGLFESPVELNAYLWGYGTSYAQAFERIAQLECESVLPLLVLGDGFNEANEWSAVENSFAAMVSKHDLRIFLVGVPQRVICSDSKITAHDRWHQLFAKYGLMDFFQHPDSPTGYYIDSRPFIPPGLLEPRINLFRGGEKHD